MLPNRLKNVFFKWSKVNLSLLLLMLSSILMAQNSENVEEFWENGKIKVSGSLIDGEKDGEWIEYNSDGSISVKGVYRNGLEEGTWNYYCTHGVLSEEVIWKAGKCYRLIYYFLDLTPQVVIEFEKGITSNEFSQYYENAKAARVAQVELFDKSVDLDSRSIHYLASNKFSYYRFSPSIHVNGKYYLLPRELLARISGIEFLLLRSFKEMALESEQPMTYTFLKGDNDFYEHIRVDKAGNIFQDSLSYYGISPFGRYVQKSFLNGKPSQMIEYHSAVEWSHTCRRFYSNGKLESVGKYEKGKREGKWKYFTFDGDLYKEIKFKADIPKKTTNYKMDQSVLFD